jgi:hypothetical protein
MTKADEFAIALAERLAPDEIDSAPAILAAVRRGSPPRKNASGAPVTGGVFGLAEATQHLSDIYNTCVACSPYLHAALEWILDGVHVVVIAEAVRQWRAGGGKGDDTDGAVPSEILEALNHLRDDLRGRGFDPANSEEVAAGTVDLLAARPDEGVAFLAALSGA